MDSDPAPEQVTGDRLIVQLSVRLGAYLPGAERIPIPHKTRRPLPTSPDEKVIERFVTYNAALVVHDADYARHWAILIGRMFTHQATEGGTDVAFTFELVPPLSEPAPTPESATVEIARRVSDASGPDFRLLFSDASGRLVINQAHTHADAFRALAEDTLRRHERVLERGSRYTHFYDPALALPLVNAVRVLLGFVSI